MNIFLICLSGLPSSGKSSFASTVKHALEEKLKSVTVKIVDPDLIRMSLTRSEFDYKKEKKVRKKSLRETRKFLKDGFIVIHDDLNYYSSMRHDLKDIAAHRKVPFFIVHISTPIEQCLMWNEARGTKVPNQIIRAINEKFDPFGKYNWDTPIKTYNLSQVSNLDEEIAKLLDLVISIPTPSRSAENTYNGNIQPLYNSRANEKLDIITREIVGKLLKNPNYQHLAKQLTKHRKQFVKSFLNSNLSEKEIANKFTAYLESTLRVKIDQKSL